MILQQKQNQHVIHQDGDRDTFQEGNVQFATDFVATLFMTQCMSRGTEERLLRALASPLNTSSSSRGQFFELIMHPIIRCGGTYDFRFVDVPCPVPPGKGPGRPAAASKKAVDSSALKSATLSALAAQSRGCTWFAIAAHHTNAGGDGLSGRYGD